MLKIIYIPMDERPCNTHMVERIAATTSDISLLTVPNRFLGNKKQPADTEKIWTWLWQEASDADAVILSMDMLIYGGLLPSRLHHLPEAYVQKNMEWLRSLRTHFPHLKIYASNVIMRTPRYSSSDEEPDYYENWGREIFLQAYYKDKSQRNVLSEGERQELKAIENRLPKVYKEDYENRREFNLQVNLQVLNLVNEDVITFLAIPQDDSAEYGYTAIDQNEVTIRRESLRLYESVHIYPGADEVGATLLARAYNNIKKKVPSIYPIWSSTLGPQLIPMYEDRPFAESLKSHVMAAGCTLTDSPEQADLILAYNTPGKLMQEAWDSPKDNTYFRYRNLLMFRQQIKTWLNKGKKVIVADSAFANGGDSEFITLLDEAKILDQLTSYKGWNTNCNTLGSTLAQGVIADTEYVEQIQENLLYHILDDYLYQTEIRMEMLDDFLPDYQLDYFNLKDKAKLVNIERNDRLRKRLDEVVPNSFEDIRIQTLHTFSPWNRMFECGIELKIKKI